jgi:tripartite-type tricarboxylate transporter receptor subunit TctC
VEDNNRHASMMTPRRTDIAAIATVAVMLASGARGQSYPERIIEMVIPGTPGNSADIVGRVLMDGMSKGLGQHLIAINKPGADGIVATSAVAQAKPDGYTLLHGAAWTLTVAPLTELHTAYTRKSFDPICQTFKNEQVIVARPNTYRTVAELIASNKAKSGGLNYGTPGIGTIPHLAMAELAQMANTEFNQVPFRSTADSIQMTLAGQVDFAVAPLTAVANSNLTMLGLFAAKRNPSIPDVRTLAEQGFDVSPLSVGGVLAPAGLPTDVRGKLEAACMAAMQTDAFKFMAKTTFQPSDFSGDASVFTLNIDKDAQEKQRLLTALGMAKKQR